MLLIFSTYYTSHLLIYYNLDINCLISLRILYAWSNYGIDNNGIKSLTNLINLTESNVYENKKIDINKHNIIIK